MRNKFRLFTLLLMFGLVFALVACTDEEDPVVTQIPTELDVLGAWEDGGDGVYTISTNTASELEFSYAKSTFTYAYMMMNLTDDLSTYKKLVLTVEGSGTMLVKLETSDNTPAKEISINVTGISGSYEWNLINDSEFLAKVNKVVIIAAPGKENSVGNITVTELKFDQAVAANYIIQTNFNNIPQNVNEYDGVASTFDFNDKWENFSEETYTITYANDETNVAFDKGAGFEWSLMKSQVQGDFTDFNYIVLLVSGTEGQKLLAKPNNFNAYEESIFLSSEPQALVMDITNMPLTDKNAITEIYVFGAAGTAPITGEFVIHEAYFAEEYDVVVVEPVWMGYGLTVLETETDVTITYANTPATWWDNNAQLAIADFNESKTAVVFTYTGVAGQEYVFKIEGGGQAKEVTVSADGTEQQLVINLSDLTEAQRAALNLIVVFSKTEGASGSLVVNNWEYYAWKLQGTVTLVESGTDANISYTGTPANWWENNAQLSISEFDGTQEGIVFTFTGVVGHEYLFKIEGGGQAKELAMIADGNEQQLTLSLTNFTEAQRNGLNLIVIFVKTVGAEGTVVFHGWDYAEVEAVDPIWMGYGLTVVETETDVTITYANTPATWWDNNAQLDIVGFNGAKQGIVFTYTGVAGQEYVFKIEGGGQAKEVTVGADGTEQVYVLNLTEFTEAQRAGFNKLVIFAKTEGASGSLVVNTWEYYAWLMQGGMTIVDSGSDVSLSYTSTPANWWESNAQLSIGEFDGTNEGIAFTFTGVLGHEYLFKIEGGGQAKELAIVADGTEQELVISLFTMTAAQRDGLNLIVIFVKTEAAEGTLVFSGWDYAVVEPAVPVWMGYGLTVVETETDVTITYANTPANWWENNAQLEVIGFDGSKTGIVFTYTGVAGQEYVFKIEGGGQAKEVTVSADGTEQTYTLDLSEFSEVQRDGFNKLVIFSKTAGASGSLVVNTWEYVMPE